MSSTRSGSKTPSTSGDGRTARTVAVIGALGVILAAVAAGLFTLWPANRGEPAPSSPAPVPPSASPAVSECRVQIMMPAANQRVAKPTQLQGQLVGCPGLPPDVTLWSANRAEAKSKVHPMDQPCLVLPNNTWRCDPLYLGQATDSGKSFRVTSYTANPSAHAVLIEYARREPKDYVGLDAMPPGTTPVAEQRVMRQ